MTLKTRLRPLGRKARRGAVALEYALVLAFVAIAVLAAMNSLGGKLKTTIDTVGDNTKQQVASGIKAP